MKHFTRIVAMLLALFFVQVVNATDWTISVTPNGTRGGFVETADGKSQHAIQYSVNWPAEGHVPVFYVHFPVGTFAVTSANDAAVRVNLSDCSSGDVILANALATSFSFTSAEEGWYRMELTGGTPGTTVLKDFTVTSTNATGTNANVFLSAWRSIPSLHLNSSGSTNASLPTGTAFDWIYDEVLIPTDADYYGTYVESFGFGGGYIGIQNNGENGGDYYRTIIFSIWDNGDTDADPTLAAYKRSGVVQTCTEGERGVEEVIATRFGGEGSGSSIRLQGNLWKAGQWVKFLLNARPEQIQLSDGTSYNNTLYSAWYWAEGIDTEWHYIGTIRKAGVSTHFGSGLNAFLEEFTRGNNSQGGAPHKAYYRRMFTRSMQTGNWYNLNQFWWSHTDGGTADGARNDYYQTAIDNFMGEPAMYMQSGGYIDPYTGGTSIPYVKPDGIVPTNEVLEAMVNGEIKSALQQQDKDRMQIGIDATVVYTDVTEGWTVASATSEDTYESHLKEHAIDGDNATFWQNKWAGGMAQWPHQIAFLHDGAVTIDQVKLTFGSRNDRRPASVRFDYSANGTTWTEGSEVFPCTDSQEQTFTLSTPINAPYVRLHFPQGNTATGTNPINLAEVNFLQVDHNIDNIRALAQSYLDGADQFNGYDSTDPSTALLLSTLRNFINEDYNTIATALNALAAGGKLLKYGEVTQKEQLSAERAYYLFNPSGYGAMVVVDGVLTLRNADPVEGSSHYSDCQAQYKQSASVVDAGSNWLLLTTDKFPGYYYLYNIGAGKFLNPLHSSTLTDEPQPLIITKFSNGFVIEAANYTYTSGNGTMHTQLCLAPQFATGPVSMWNNDPGNYFIIYDNYSVTPSAELIAELRDKIYRASRQQAGTVEVVNLGGSIGTYANERALDFSAVEGLKAYRAASYNDATGILTLTDAEQVAAGEGLLLRGTAGEYEVPYLESASAQTNMLVGVTTATSLSPTSGIYTNFILSNGSNGIGFYPVSGGTLAAGKAYLQIPSAQLGGEARSITLRFDDDGETTGIVGASHLNDKCKMRNEMFDLQGRRVANPRCGLYIVNGKKVVIR